MYVKTEGRRREDAKREKWSHRASARHKPGGEMLGEMGQIRHPASTRLWRRPSPPISALGSRVASRALSARHGPRRRGPSAWLTPGRAGLNTRSARAGPRGPVHAHRAQRRGRRPAKAAAAVAVTDDARRRGGRLRELRRRPHHERPPGWRRGRRQRAGRPPSVVGRHTQLSLQRQQCSLALQAGSLIGAEDIAQSIHQ